MTKRELIEANEELCDALLALRAMIDEALAASGIDPDEEEGEPGEDEDDDEEEDEEQAAEE